MKVPKNIKQDKFAVQNWILQGLGDEVEGKKDRAARNAPIPPTYPVDVTWFKEEFDPLWCGVYKLGESPAPQTEDNNDSSQTTHQPPPPSGKSKPSVGPKHLRRDAFSFGDPYSVSYTPNSMKTGLMKELADEIKRSEEENAPHLIIRVKGAASMYVDHVTARFLHLYNANKGLYTAAFSPKSQGNAKE